MSPSIYSKNFARSQCTGTGISQLTDLHIANNEQKIGKKGSVITESVQIRYKLEPIVVSEET